MNDLSAQFFLTEADIGRSRAAVSAPKLAELNPYVAVSHLSGPLVLPDLTRYTVVVLIETPLERQLLVAEFCHANNIW